MRLATPADKRFKRAQLKPARRRAIPASWRWRAAVVAALVAVVGYAAYRAVDLVARMGVFGVRHVVIHGNRRLSNGEVLALIDGIQGESILALDLDHWRAVLMRSPWVADAVLHRTLPASVDVTVREPVPLGIARINTSLYLVDESGAVIDEYGPHYADIDLPIIDGLTSLPGSTAVDNSRALLVRQLLESVHARAMAARISQIDVSDSHNAIVLLDGDPTSIRLGNQHFAERLQSYVELAPALRERVSEIDYVDMRFDERVYVRPAARAGSPSKAPASRTRTKALAAKS
jgi:cell division protein FtsQ